MLPCPVVKMDDPDQAQGVHQGQDMHEEPVVGHEVPACHEHDDEAEYHKDARRDEPAVRPPDKANQPKRKKQHKGQVLMPDEGPDIPANTSCGTSDNRFRSFAYASNKSFTFFLGSENLPTDNI